jgi:RHS repeat-associated protein
MAGFPFMMHMARNLSGMTAAPPISDANADLFRMHLDYNTPDALLSAVPQKNGNISAAVWQVLGHDKQAFTYKYDDLDRLTEAKYADVTYANTTTTVPTFSTDNKFGENLTYDLRGNITSLVRRGFKLEAFTTNSYVAANYEVIDNLNYNYNGKNQVMGINESASATKGFKFKNNSTSAYTYDANGNLKSDINKDITNIEYNYLNLPTRIEFVKTETQGGTTNLVEYKIEFVYTATGQKLRKLLYNSIGLLETIDYINGLEYRNGVPEKVMHSEGYLSIALDTSGYKFSQKYALRDHLGNTRLTFSDANNDGTVTQADIEQENHYYAFGLNMEGNWNGAAGPNKYQYNGKEWNDDFGLGWNDYGARFYDPATGRFTGIDLLADVYSTQTPYAYAGNSPVSFIDFMGMAQLGFDDVPENDPNYDPSKDPVLLPTITVTAKRGESVEGGYDFQAFLDEQLRFEQEGKNGQGTAPREHNSGGLPEDLTFIEKHFNGGLGFTGVAVNAYDKIPNKIKRHYAYKLSKATGWKSGKIFQNTKAFAKEIGKSIPKAAKKASYLSGAAIAYDLLDDGNLKSSSVVNGTLLTIGLAFPVTAPFIIGYGILDYSLGIGDRIDKHLGPLKTGLYD